MKGLHIIWNDSFTVANYVEDMLKPHIIPYAADIGGSFYNS